MIHLRRITLIEYRRKGYIAGLFIMMIIIAGLTPIFNSISLGQGAIVNQAFQYTAIEIIGLLFLVYFGSSVIKNFENTKTLQLLRSKQKRPLSFLFGTRLGLYSIYAGFILSSGIIASLYYGESIVFLHYSGLLLTGAIALSFAYLFSFLTNAYAAMIASLIIIIISYSLNFIIFSTPIAFEGNISFKLLTKVQYLFPRLDLISNTMTAISGRGIVANLLYFIGITSVVVYVFLYRIAK